MIDGIPKTIAVLILTNPFLKYAIEPIAAVKPTINSEYAVAETASTEKRYTNTGTVKILPPLPINPSEIPIRIDAM